MSSRFAIAVAHPNIALAKYWGKREGAGGASQSPTGDNVPATPSLSITLSGLTTKTRVTFDATLRRDSLTINRADASATSLARAAEILERVRSAAKIATFARVESENDFPTASGLASSASGFSALALAATRAAGLDADVTRVAELARLTSASAARSFFSGYAELVPEEGGARANAIAAKDHLPISMLACVVTEDEKSVSSSDGMKRVAKESPYYAAWTSFAASSFSEIRAALLRRDLEALGDLTEKNAFAMHATCTAIGVFYMLPETLRVLSEVRNLRKKGLFAYATMDAGPHVKVLCENATRDAVRAALAEVPGVLRVITSEPGDGARVIEEGGA